jgi:TRAP-type C4-dicarboxylate transport system substrate-binding protein
MKQTTKHGRGIMTLFLVLLGAFIFCAYAEKGWAQPAQKKVFKWRMQSFLPAGNAQNMVNRKWVEELKEITEGQLDIKFFGVNEIVPTTQAWEACSKGVFEMIWDWSGYWTGKTLMAGFATGIPYTMRNASDYIALMRGQGLLEMIRKAYAKHNLFLVNSFPAHAQVFMSKFPVRKVDDFKGRKIRTAGFMADVLKEAGASPVFFPMGEVYGALERGVIEGSTMAINTHYSYGIPEVTKYLLMTPINDVEGLNVIVNMDAWKSLPNNLKILLEHSASNLGERHSNYAYTADVETMPKLKKKGIILTYLSEEERSKMAGFAVKVLDAYSKKDPDFAKAAEVVKNYMRAVGVLK